MSESETNYLVVVYSYNVCALYPQGFALPCRPSQPIRPCQGPRPLSPTGAHLLGKFNNNMNVLAVFELHSKF